MSTHNFHNPLRVPLRDPLGLSAAVTFQGLRRSHATRNQATPQEVRGHRGHNSTVITLGIYSQEIPASVKAMVEADEGAILSGSNAIAP